jgi:hypothetical protein
MADTLIAGLTAISAANIDPATDLLALVDTSDPTLDATGTTKKATVAAVLTGLYDKTSGDLLMEGDNQAVTIQDNIDFVSHGKLILEGLDPTLGAGSGTTGPIPTWFDPVNSTVWSDNGWFAFEYDEDIIEMFVGQGDANTFLGTAFWKETALHAPSGYFAQGYSFAIDESGIDISEAGINARAKDGEYYASIFCDLSVGGLVRLSVDSIATNGAKLLIQGVTSQTGALLALKASDNASVIEATGDKKIGFFNATPIAQQTGVAVSTAAIHAALVNIGIITA